LQHSKRQLDDDAVDKPILATSRTNTALSTPINKLSTSSSECNSTNLSSLTSISLSKKARVSSTGATYRKSHIYFSGGKHLFLQDYMNPIEEAALELNEKTVCHIQKLFLLL